MKLKEKIYRKLDGARGRSFSGEELAEEFGVSRNAVWKAVKSLQAEGFAIAAVPNRGYSLAAENDKLTPSGVEKFLAGGGYQISVADSTGSVLDDLKEAVAKGAPAWSVRIAEEQTAGRGRFGRPFYSPKGAGLYIGILLRPKLTAAETLFITTSAAVAVCEALESVCPEPCEIKWVNDVFRYYVENIPQRAFYAEYRRRSFVIGKRVEVRSGDLCESGVALDLDENCFLKVRLDNGQEKLLSGGEVSIKVQ